jgi:membrane associated rhomboid family serine protease
MALVLGDENPEYREPPVTNLTLVVVNIAVFFIAVLFPYLLLPNAANYSDIIDKLGLVPIRIVEGEALYTLFTSMFLHGGLTHLFGNMLYLYIFGDNIEYVMGKIKYLVFYLLSGLGATAFHIFSLLLLPKNALFNAVLTTGVNPWLIPAIGASGAISGVLGAYALFFPTSEVRVVTFWTFIPFIFRIPALAYILFWFIFQLIMGLSVVFTGVQAGVAFWAHIGGFLTGIALAPLFADRKKLIAARRYYGL